MKNLQQQILGLQSLINTQQRETKNEQEFFELKYLVQRQFEAIQKLLQRIANKDILKESMSDQFISNAEQINMDDTKGNLNIEVIPSNTLIIQKEISNSLRLYGNA